MTFWKTSFWTSISAIAKLSSQFLVAKIIAVYAGAAAFGVIGQFQSFISLVQIVSGSIISSGVVKYVAEYHDNISLLKSFIQTACKFAFLTSIISGIFIACFSFYISDWVFQDNQYWWIIAVFGITLCGFTINQVFLSILNGLRQMLAYTAVSVISSILSIILIGGLSYYFKVKGALFGMIVAQIFLFPISYFFRKKAPVRLTFIKNKIDRSALSKLLKFSLMAVTSAIVIPITQMVIRSYVAACSSWVDVGYWQGLMKISDAYLMIITLAINTYVMPQYSRIVNNVHLKKEVFSVIRKLLPLTVLSASVIYLLRDKIVILLFSREFLSMQGLFFFQLLGDIVKIISWVIANVLVAKAKVKIYIASEVTFSASYLILSIVFFNYFSIKGLTIAFFANYLLYFSFIYAWFFNFIKHHD